MKIAYFDCFSGASGDMMLGALAHAGLDEHWLKAEMKKVRLDGYVLDFKKTTRHGLSGVQAVVKTQSAQHPRGFWDIKRLVERSALTPATKAIAIRIFHDLARVESRIHGVAMEKIHFHEIGAVDSLVDIIGTVAGLEKMGIEKVYASRIPLGSGFVDCQHGRLPVPAPATVELLKGVPVYDGGFTTEVTTPTAAAILKNVVVRFGSLPEMTVETTGYGFGTKDLGAVNGLRVMVGTAAGDVDFDETVFQLETNIDDMNPQLYDHACERLREAGCLEVFLTPVQMKKNRPGILLTAVADRDHLERAVELILTETTSIGLRIKEVGRRKLDRVVKNVPTPFGPVDVKISSRQGRIMNIAPEYESCKMLARHNDVPLKQITQEAHKAALRRYGARPAAAAQQIRSPGRSRPRTPR